MHACFSQLCVGEVVNVSEDNITVVFCDNDDIFERSLPIGKFIGDLPQKGDCLELRIIITKVPKEERETRPSKPRKNVVPMPRTF
jgi:hypothetical protein